MPFSQMPICFRPKVDGMIRKISEWYKYLSAFQILAARLAKIQILVWGWCNVNKDLLVIIQQFLFLNYCVWENEVSIFLLTCVSKNSLFSLQTHELTHSKCRGWKCECVVCARHDISLTWQLAANKYGCKQCTFRQLKRIISVLFLTQGINSTQCILMSVNNCVQEGPGGILIVQLQARGNKGTRGTVAHNKFT